MIRQITLDSLLPSYDLVIIGAGPAGMAASAQLKGSGLSILVVDDGKAPGGQIYRGYEAAPASLRSALGTDYQHGGGVISTFRQSEADYLPSATVWTIESGPRLAISSFGKSRLVTARAVLAATGAMERPMPIKGWTLPGVMGVGAGQTLLKSAGLTPSPETVLVGSGPLIWAYAWQLQRLGTPVQAILDTTPRTSALAALPYAPGFLATSYAMKGAQMVAAVRRRTTVFSAVEAVSIGQNADGLELSFRHRGLAKRLSAPTVMVHQGVVPNLNLVNAAGCDLAWDGDQGLWKPQLDRWGASSIARVWVAGDAGGIRGAKGAEAAGRLAALDVLRALAKLAPESRDALSSSAFASARKAGFGRRFIDHLYTPPTAARRGAPEATVCRCEEITGAQVRDTASRLQVTGPNQLKSFLRCGMGPCQGRMCGLTVTEIIADARDLPQPSVGLLRQRPPIKPMTVHELASLHEAKSA